MDTKMIFFMLQRLIALLLDDTPQAYATFTLLVNCPVTSEFAYYSFALATANCLRTSVAWVAYLAKRFQGRNGQHYDRVADVETDMAGHRGLVLGQGEQ